MSYFLWDAEHRWRVPGQPCPSRRRNRVLLSPGIWTSSIFSFVRTKASSILRKVRARKEPTFDQRVSSQKPFDLHTNFDGAPSKKGVEDPVLMYGGAQRVTWIPRASIEKNADWIDSWKVFLPKASDGNETFPAPIWDLARGPFVGRPGEIC